MITSYMPAYWKELKIHMVVFDQGDNRGHMFYCDENGVLKEMTDAKRAEYEFCMAHPDYFIRFNKVVEFSIPLEVVEKGVCECGYTVFLRDAGNFGTCKCPKCKRVYDIHGREYINGKISA